MKDPQHKRITDEKLINRVAENAWMKFTQQVLTFVAAPLLGFCVHLYQDNSKKLDDINMLLTQKVATYDEHFISTDQRVTRLENRNDHLTPGQISSKDWETSYPSN